MRILVIGATGLTGQQIVKKALETGHLVTVLVRNPDKDLPDLWVLINKHINIILKKSGG